jgi:phosphopentomutase
VLVVLDGVGVGALPDAGEYGDEGSNTLVNTALQVGGLSLPNLARLGLGRLAMIAGVPPAEHPAGAFGTMAEASAGKDTITGHWELMGLWLDKPFRTYPRGFPDEIISALEREIGRRTLGNKPASGTEIIKELGELHMKTGSPIVYTSADSVLQIAAHEEIVPVQELYRTCEIARGMLVGDHLVARVIARPFEGRPGEFRRTARRKDFAVEPRGRTALDCAVKRGLCVRGIGKIQDIFAGRGVTESVHTDGNAQGIGAIQSGLVEQAAAWDIMFTNLVDFDMLYGHRNDVPGMARALEEFDRSLPRIVALMREDDILIITADHGCDPTTESTDHSREYVPLLVFGQHVIPGTHLGVRPSFSDVGRTMLDHMGVVCEIRGMSFLPQLRR